MLLCGKTGDVEMDLGLKCLKGKELYWDVLFVLHGNALDDFVAPRVSSGQINRLEVYPVAVAHLVERIPLVVAVVVVVDGRRVLSDLKCNNYY